MSDNLILGRFTVGAPESPAQEQPQTPPATPPPSTPPADNPTAPAPPTPPAKEEPSEGAKPDVKANVDNPPTPPATPAADIFKELGIDPTFGRSLLQAAADPAKLQELAQTMAMDPKAMTTEQALRMDTQSRYPNFTPEQIAQETAFRMRTEFFQSEDADPNDKARGDLKLQALLGQAQEGLSKKQAAFTTSVSQAPAPQAQAPQTPPESAVALAKDPFFQTFNETRKLSFGSGEEKYHFDMSGVDLDKYASDPAQLAGLILNEDGSVNGRSVAILEALKRKPDLFDDVHKHGGTLREAAEFEERHNAKEQNLPPAPAKSGHKVLGGRFTVGE